MKGKMNNNRKTTHTKFASEEMSLKTNHTDIQKEEVKN